MPISRRTFMAAAATTLAASSLSSTPRPAAKPLSILILGGTGFIGPHQVRYAVARGHKVTLFNRGKTNPGLFPDVEHLEGDRDGQLDALKGRKWDAVVDNAARIPRWVRDTAQLLKDSAGQYLFVSTVSVYARSAQANLDETAALVTLDDPTTETVNDATYGGLKVLAEKEAEKAFGGSTTIVRPGLLAGPGDTTDRFTYWPVRIARGGEVLAPGEPTDRVQFIDVRDFAEFTIRLLEQRAFGTFNVTGPESPLTIAEMLTGIRAATAADATFTWVPAGFLAQHEVRAWSDMPVWIPPIGDSAGFARRSIKRALAAGLTFRPLAETAKAALADAKGKTTLKAGLTAEREAEVLAAWKAAQASKP